MAVKKAYRLIPIGDLRLIQRSEVDDDSRKMLQGLTASMKSRGWPSGTPLPVRTSEDGKYEIRTAGLMFQAARDAGLKVIPCVICFDAV